MSTSPAQPEPVSASSDEDARADSHPALPVTAATMREIETMADGRRRITYYRRISQAERTGWQEAAGQVRISNE